MESSIRFTVKLKEKEEDAVADFVRRVGVGGILLSGFLCTSLFLLFMNEIYCLSHFGFPRFILPWFDLLVIR